MPVDIKKLFERGVQIYPQTIGQAVYIESEAKTLDVVLAQLKAKDVIVDTALSATSGNAIANKAVKAGLDLKLDTTTFNAKIGAINGIAPLDANKKIPAVHLPGYVDDVLDIKGFILDKDKNKLLWLAILLGAEYYYITDTKKLIGHDATTLTITESTPESGKLYINEDDNKTYRWSGSNMVVISETIALGETASTAYAGNKGKANADAIAGLAILVEANKEQILLHADDINNLNNEVTNAKADIIVNENGISALQTSLSAEKGKVTTLQTQMTTANNAIANHTTSIGSLNTGLGTANGNITALGTRVATIEGKYISAVKVGTKVYNEIPAGAYS